MSTDNQNRQPIIEQQVEEIISGGALGKSDAFVRLLRFLADRAKTQKSIKEIEIAIEVFGRDETFDVTQDSLVRVYIHKLRTKLDSFYQTTDNKYSERLIIPKGSYLLQLEKNNSAPSTSKQITRFLSPTQLAVILLSLVVGAMTVIGFNHFSAQSRANALAINSPIWSPLTYSGTPLLVVVGDQFIFSEVTVEFEQLREIRDFSISGSADFERRLNADQNFAQSHRDFGVRYLPSAAASAIREFAVFASRLPDWRVKLASEVEAEDLENFNILYLGHYTALGGLKELAFAGSSLQLHPNGNLLIQQETGEVFVGAGQLGSGYRDRYIDYAVLRKLSLESGNSLFVLMSARDPGLENLASFVFSNGGTEDIESRLMQPVEDFEVLLEVSGTGQDDLISQIRMTQP